MLINCNIVTHISDIPSINFRIANNIGGSREDLLWVQWEVLYKGRISRFGGLVHCDFKDHFVGSIQIFERTNYLDPNSIDDFANYYIGNVYLH